uniref:YTH domain-containing protein n=1 Tax=Salix viminalis TaxID=40686 RepID=A0A6N2LAT9_SALVM
MAATQSPSQPAPDRVPAGHPRDTTGQPGAFGSPGDRAVYPPNIYAPQAQAFYYRGYDNATGEWDEYPPYINAEGLEIGSPGVYNDNPSLVFHAGYAYSPQMPYGPYSPVTTPLPSVGGDAQLYSPQQFPFSGPPYYQHLGPNMSYITSPTPVSQPEFNTLVNIDQQGDNMLFGPRPSYPPPVGSIGRGSFPGNHGFYDQQQGFDGLRSGGLWSDWSKPSDRNRPLTPFSPPVSPQPIGNLVSFGQNVGMASQQQRSFYGAGSGSSSYNRAYLQSGYNQGSSFGSASISSLGTNSRGWLSLENNRRRGRSSVSLCGCNGSLDILSEQNRGPRASKPKAQNTAEHGPSVETNKHIKPSAKIHDESYNHPDFVIEYEDAKFFIIKSYSEDNVHKSIKYGVWASTPNGNRKLDTTYREAKEKQDPCPVFLLFSVNASAQFCGVAEMTGPVDFDKSVDYWQQDKWNGQFPVKWHLIKDVPNSQFRHIVLENNDNKPVTNSRDTQEVGIPLELRKLWEFLSALGIFGPLNKISSVFSVLENPIGVESRCSPVPNIKSEFLQVKLEQGIEMLSIFKNYETDMSILDDFDFYEDRQKAMQERKARQQGSIMAGVVGESEHRNAVTLPTDIIKQMTKSFAQVVCLDESGKEGTVTGSRVSSGTDAYLKYKAREAWAYLVRRMPVIGKLLSQSLKQSGSSLYSSSNASSSSSIDFWFQNERMNFGYVWATPVALLVILIFHFSKRLFSFPPPPPPPKQHLVSSSPASTATDIGFSNDRISEIVSEADLKFLIEVLDEKLTEKESDKWENVTNKRNNLLAYKAKCFKPKDAPIKYLSVMVFEDCTTEVLRDFYMDNDYRNQWDKTIVGHEQLQVDKTNGTEIGHTVKKFPLLTPREYVLAWRLWEGKDKTFYCFIKDCEHPLAARQKKFVRVKFFRSVPGRNACEIKMFHQEDAGLNVEMAKLAFSRGIWSYVCKMNNALRKYSVISHPPTGPAVTAVSLIQKVPPGLETTNSRVDTQATLTLTAPQGLVNGEAKERKFSRRPSRKVIGNGLLLLGGIICLSRGRSSLCAKVAMAYILTKLRKPDESSSQGMER